MGNLCMGECANEQLCSQCQSSCAWGIGLILHYDILGASLFGLLEKDCQNEDDSNITESLDDKVQCLNTGSVLYLAEVAKGRTKNLTFKHFPNTKTQNHYFEI